MNKIIINPHNCTAEEYQDLIDYLEHYCWDYRIENYQLEIKK